MRDDAELLRRYALEHDNEAFSELVRRTIDFVYATALRQCRGNAALAQDVTQLVFTDLARRAGTIVRHPALAGWLHTATRFAAMKVLRSETRRQLRDQRAAELQSLLADEGTPIDWTQLQPVLDEAIGELKERDRAAIVLRFLQGKSLLEVGASLQLSETAARSCVDRALDRLRGQLERRGITSTCAALGVTLAQQIGAAAPAGLASVVGGVAIAESALGGSALVPIFAMKKILLVTAALVLVAEFAVATVEFKTKSSLEADFAQLRSAETTSTATASSAETLAFTPATPYGMNVANETSAETARLQKRLAELKARPPGVVDAQMKAPRAAGRATPRDAMQTVTAAVRDRDLPTLERMVHFSDDTQENRAAFMANFSAAVRGRYSTPERLMIATIFEEVLRDPPVAQQVLATHGYAGGVETVTTWTRLASGLERKDENPFQSTPEGWAFPAFPLTGKAVPVDRLRARFDPVTGDVILRKP